MSFLNKIKALGQKPDEATGDNIVPLGMRVERAFAGASVGDAGSPAAASAARFNVSTQAPSGNFDSSIISEAAPSGMAEFSESRLAPRDSTMVPLGSGLPLIGNRPLGEQRRILVGCIVLGLMGLVLMALYSLNAASSG